MRLDGINYTLSCGDVMFITEHRFHPVRKWRFDFCIPSKMVAVELEGGVFVNGRHTRAVGYAKDCEKYNEATILGWRVLRYTKLDVGEILNDVEKLIGNCDKEQPSNSCPWCGAGRKHDKIDL